MDIQNALITSAISLSGFSLYKIINHYRLKSSCNSNNELVISVVDIELQNKHVSENIISTDKIDPPASSVVRMQPPEKIT